VGNISTYRERIGCTIDALAEEVLRLVCVKVPNTRVIFREKDPETLAKKILLKKASDVFSINDVYGLRIIVESMEEAYLALESIKRTLPGFLDHDYIKEPKVRVNEPFKGKALRLLQFIAYRNGASFEIQITTSEFNATNNLLHEEYHRRRYRFPNL